MFLVLLLAYGIALILALMSMFTAWFIVIAGFPLFLLMVRHIKNHIGEVSIVPAMMTAWLVGFAMLNGFMDVSLNRFLLFIFMIMSSVFAGIAMLFLNNRIAYKNPRLELQTRERKESTKEKFERYHESVEKRKEYQKRIGLAAWVIDLPEEYKHENAMDFHLGKEVELERDENRDYF